MSLKSRLKKKKTPTQYVLDSGGVKTMRYADYIEKRHINFLDKVVNARDTILDDSPFSVYESLDVDEAFFTAGYIISSMRSMTETFGTFMQGVDVESRWVSAVNARLFAHEIDDTTKATTEALYDNLYDDVRLFKVKMRDCASVQTSTFVVGRSLIEQGRINSISAISSENKFNMISDIYTDFSTELNWNKSVVMMQGLLIKFYFMSMDDIIAANHSYDIRDKLWSMEVLEFERAALASFAGRMPYIKTYKYVERSNISKMLFILNYTVQGATIGYQISGNPYGAAVGAAIGSNVGIAYMLSESPGSMSFQSAFIKTWGLQTAFTIDPIVGFIFYKLFF